MQTRKVQRPTFVEKKKKKLNVKCCFWSSLSTAQYHNTQALCLL